mgnify:CR=1 FL=1
MRHIIVLFYYHLSVIIFAISAGSGAVNDIHSPVIGWAIPYDGNAVPVCLCVPYPGYTSNLQSVGTPDVSYGCGSDVSGRSQASERPDCVRWLLYKSVMCDGFFTVFKINRALDDGAFFSGKRSTDGSGRRCDTALYYGKIFPVHFAVLVIVERILPLIRCLDTTVRPEVSRSRRLQQRKMKGFPCS